MGTLRRRLLCGVLAVLAVIVIGWVGIEVAHRTADRSRDASIPGAAASAAEQEAHLFWDNPFQRIFYVASSTVNVQQGPSCPRFEVIAFTLFGIEMDHVLVDCEGINRSP